MSKIIVLRAGLNLPVTGQAEMRIAKTVSPIKVAVCPDDFPGFTPRLLVREGDTVLCGSPVLADKNRSEILVASPVSGTVKEIVRGEKRKLLAVVVEQDGKRAALDFKPQNPAELEPSAIKAALLESGLWPFIIQRPYGIIANPADEPKAVFVSAFDTAPLAANAAFALGDRLPDIQKGIDALGRIATVHIGLPAKNAEPFDKLENAEKHIFEGRHPAGNVGVQISHVCPVTKGSVVWTVSLLGLAAIGALFTKGRYDVRRKVAVAGCAAIEPAYADTIPGAPMSTLGGFFGATDDLRIVSGNILSGKTVGKEGWLGFYDNTVTVLKEGYEKELLGWANPIRWKLFSTDHSYFSWLTPWRKYDMDTNLHGGPRAFVMSDGYYKKVLPMDIFPVYLLKACLAGDIDAMEKFGIYEVIPEDLALCEYIDPSKNDIQEIIANGIRLMLKEME